MPQLLAQVDASQSSGSPQRLSLLLVDLDRLKPINDEFGHEAMPHSKVLPTCCVVV